MAQFPVSLPTDQVRQSQAITKKPSEFEQIQLTISEEIGKYGSRLRLIEQRVDGLRAHLQLLDSTVLEKHKTIISKIKDIEDNLRGIRAELDSQKELLDRLAKRMEALASAEEVKVLRRYVELWQPLQFVTRSEVKALIQNALKEMNIKLKEGG